MFRLGVFFKGMAMGMADVVPGVSGGTIAFIAGIYEELIDTINKVNFKAVQILFKEGIGPFWKYINGTFLISLLSGIAISIVSLAKLITYLLAEHPVLIWSFFFGLVLASIPFMARHIKKWNVPPIIAFIIGTLIAYWITILPASAGEVSLPYLFLSGMIAICAMILPGISGSFIMLLMGVYPIVLGAIHNFELSIIVVFASGAIIGLLSFAKVLKWMFANYHDITIAVLSGFLLGSLNKVWPWKQVMQVFVKHPNTAQQEIVPILEKSVSPTNFNTPVVENGNIISYTSAEPQIMAAIFLMVVGICVIVVLEKLGSKQNNTV